MEVSELSQLAHWILEKIEKRGIETRFSELVERIRTNTMPGQQRVPFQSERDALFHELRSIPLYELTAGQHGILQAIGLLPNIGEYGVGRIERALLNSGLDIASALEEVEKMAQAVTSGVAWARDMHPKLKSLAGEAQSFDPSEEVLIRVRFTSEASIETVSELKKWSSNWYDISRGIAMLHGEKPEKVRVVGATSGSIILMLATPYAITKTITLMLTDILKVAEHVLRIRKAAEEIRSLKIKNDAAQKALSDEVEQIKKEAVVEIVAAVMARFDGAVKSTGEVQNALEKSVERLLEFSQKGGEVDFVVQEPEDDTSEDLVKSQAEIRSAVEEVRRIENTMKQLELDLRPRP